MINILLVSPDEASSKQVAVWLSESGISHQLRVGQGTLVNTCGNIDAFQVPDLLILDSPRLSDGDIDLLDRMSTLHRDMASMLITPSPSSELLLRAMQAGVRSVLPRPPNERAFRDALSRLVGKQLNGVGRDGKVLSFISCKGGSGTTFIAANLAYALATLRHKRVLLLDLNQRFGDAAHVVCEKKPPATVADICHQFDRLDAALLDACLTRAHTNLDVLAGAANPPQASECKVMHLERILDLARPLYDVIIADLGQNIDPVSILAMDRSSTIFPVFQLSIPYLRAGRSLMEIFQSLDYGPGKIHALVNAYEKGSSIDIEKLEKALGVTVAHTLPHDGKTVVNSINQGVPVLQLAPHSAIARSLVKLTDVMWPDTARPRIGLFRKMFSPKRPAGQQLKLKS